jgi:radical SAM protein with 4Fe4S-binding SPASM domain
MSLFLQPGVTVTSDKNGLFLFRQGIKVKHRLGAAEALALTFLSVTGDREASERYCSQCLPDRNGPYWLSRVLNRYWTYLGDGPPRQLKLDWLEAFKRNTAVPQRTFCREAAPAAISWMVTLGCNRRCPYCFYETTPHRVEYPDSPPDATFPLPDAIRMVNEMAQIGTADLYLTGGEPLLRKDLSDIISQASTLKVRTHLFTKYPIKPGLAQRLAQAGLYSAVVSLDDARPKQAAALAGAPGYLEEAKTTVSSLLAVGIPVEINTVASRFNIHHLDLLVRLAIDLEAPVLSISPFRLSYPQRPSAQRLVPPPVNLEDIVNDLDQQYGHKILLKLGGSTESNAPKAKSNVKKIVCEAGVRSLDVLPDGRVTRCRYLPQHEQLIIGSLQQETIMDIWEGDPLSVLQNPTPEAFKGNACGECGSFSSCNARGRCYFTSLSQLGRLYAPDAFCLQDKIS